LAAPPNQQTARRSKPIGELDDQAAHDRKWPQFKPLQATTDSPEFKRSVERADADRRQDGGTIIHTIKSGETAIRIGGDHGFSLAELTLMNPKLAKDPAASTRRTLVLVDKVLFEEVKGAI